MTVIYFKKNGICYSYDDSANASVPPPGAIIVESVGTTFEDCNECCPAPCSCQYEPVSNPQASTLTVTLTGSYKVYPKPNCEGAPLVLSPGTSATLTSFSSCRWKGSTTGGDSVFDIDLKLVTIDPNDCHWEAVISNSTVAVAVVKNDGIEEGSYGTAESTCGSDYDKLTITSFTVAA